MSAYRPLGTFPQYFLADGTVNNGGLINFYETDLTTRKDTYSDDGLTTPNANPVVLDSAGRPTSDIWGSLAYGVVITDSLGANPRTLNNIQPDSGAGANIPSLVSGDFLTNDGSNLLWESILQLPDPTGFGANATVQTDGTTVFWAAGQTIEPGSNSLQIGTVLIQAGTGSVPSSGATTASQGVTFPTAFSALWHVEASINNSWNLTAVGYIPNFTVNGRSVNGFTLGLDTNGADSGTPIINATPFSWFAIGLA